MTCGAQCRNALLMLAAILVPIVILFGLVTISYSLANYPHGLWEWMNLLVPLASCWAILAKIKFEEPMKTWGVRILIGISIIPVLWISALYAACANGDCL